MKEIPPTQREKDNGECRLAQQSANGLVLWTVIALLPWLVGCSNDRDDAAVERAIGKLTDEVKLLSDRIASMEGKASQPHALPTTSAQPAREEQKPNAARDLNSHLDDVEATLQQILERVQGMDEIQGQRPEPDAAALAELWNRYLAEPFRVDSDYMGWRSSELLRKFGSPSMRRVRKDGETIVWRWDLKQGDSRGWHVPSAIIKNGFVISMSYVPENWPIE